MIQEQTWTLGSLEAMVVDALSPDRQPDFVVVLCHGFGAPGTDLVPLGREVLRAVPDLGEHVRFVFPAAPLSLEADGLMGGRAWWPLDLERLNRALMTRNYEEMANHVPPGLATVRQQLLDLLSEVQREWGLDTSRMILGGFSQGSILATDTVLHLEESVAALCIWSGTLMCRSNWEELAPARQGLPVQQTHGRMDMILPLAGARLLRELLSGNGLEVDYYEFDGDHTIPPPALGNFVSLLNRLIADR